MANARIIDNTAREGPWDGAVREALATAGFSIAEPEDGTAELTVLIHPAGNTAGESGYKGDLLVLSVPLDRSGEVGEPVPTEVMGSGRLKVRHKLQDPEVSSVIVDELRPLVKLFLE